MLNWNVSADYSLTNLFYIFMLLFYDFHYFFTTFYFKDFNFI